MSNYEIGCKPNCDEPSFFNQLEKALDGHIDALDCLTKRMREANNRFIYQDEKLNKINSEIEKPRCVRDIIQGKSVTITNMLDIIFTQMTNLEKII